MSRLHLLPLLIAVPAVLVAGYVHGRWTDRWTPSRAVAAAVVRLDRVPVQVGEWRGRDVALPRETITKAGIDGYVMRRYESPREGAVTILLVCGRPGPIAAHTPEVCYGGAGFEALAEPVRTRVPVSTTGPEADFFSAVFGQPTAPDRDPIRLLWAWNGSEGWEVADNPRLSFARFRCLYKLYIVRESTPIDQRAGHDPALHFTQLLLPELQLALF